MPIESWERVFADLAALSTVIAYDRPGTGRSARADGTQTGVDITGDLRALVTTLEVRPPFVLVGHSLGGLFANLYARRFPAEVAGVVLVDSSHPSQIATSDTSGTPVARLLQAAFGVVDRIRRAKPSAEIGSLETTARQIEAAGPFPDIPLVVVTGTKSLPGWLVPRAEFDRHLACQRDLVTLSPQGRQVMAERSGHMVQITEPELVVEAVRDVLALARR